MYYHPLNHVCHRRIWWWQSNTPKSQIQVRSKAVKENCQFMLNARPADSSNSISYQKYLTIFMDWATERLINGAVYRREREAIAVWPLKAVTFD